MEEINVTTNEAVVTEQPKADEPKETKVSPDEELAQLRLELAKMKRALDKSSSETASYKKQLREKQSVDEIALAEKAEKEAQREEQYQKLLKENTINRYVKGFLKLGYSEDLAEKASNAQYEGDFDELNKIQAEFQKAHDVALEAEWMKSRPQANVGVGGNEKEEDPFLKGFGM